VALGPRLHGVELRGSSLRDTHVRVFWILTGTSVVLFDGLGGGATSTSKIQAPLRAPVGCLTVISTISNRCSIFDYGTSPGRLYRIRHGTSTVTAVPVSMSVTRDRSHGCIR
jgi:hypothetical protein